MRLVRVISSEIQKGIQVIKTKFGKNVVETSDQISPFGFSSNPTKKIIAIVAETENVQDKIVIGYIDEKSLNDLGIGDSSIFSTDADGNKKATIKLRNNGSIELLGVGDNLLKFTPLNLSLQNQVTLINTEIAKIAAVLNSLLPGSYVPTPVTIDISQSKIEEIKTKS